MENYFSDSHSEDCKAFSGFVERVKFSRQEFSASETNTKGVLFGMKFRKIEVAFELVAL